MSAGSGLFQCRECKRAFTRADHLARHIRSHTQEKPFTCNVCGKQFSRADLLKRHVLGHDDGTGDGSKRLRTDDKSLEGPVRVSQACKACAAVKLKCEEEKPCPRCVKKGIECELVPMDGRRRMRDKIKPLTSHTSRTTSNDEFASTPNPVAVYSSMQSSTSIETSLDGFQLSQQALALRAQSQGYSSSTGYTTDPLLVGSTPLHAHSFNSQRDILDFNIEANLDLDELDLGLLDSYNEMFLKNFMVPNQAPTLPLAGMRDHPPGEGLSRGIAAFRKSVWKYNPGIRDYESDKRSDDFLLPEGGNFPKKDWRAMGGRIDQGSRDRILAVVLSSVELDASTIQSVSSFPSAEMLDDLANLFFHQQHSQLDPWIHPGTFNPATVLPELVVAVVASGAVTTSIPTVRKLGYALQESIRASMPRKFEGDSSLTRNLGIIQACVLALDIGLWSGNKRKIEMSEGFRHPIATVLRRAARYRASKYSPIIPLPEDKDQVLEDKWRRWIEQESYKRLIYHLFIQDTHCSMSFLVNPLISYAELTLSLPESPELWYASTAVNWKNIYLSSGTINRVVPSFIDSIHIFPATLPSHPHLDTTLANYTTLCGVWGKIWEFHQLISVSFHSNPRTEEMSLLLKNRYNELMRSLSEHSIAPVAQVTPTECRMMLDLLLMYLHVSLEDLQLFAGKEGEAESRRVLPVLKRWHDSQASRQAVWYAGQVLRQAKMLPGNRLRNFYTVAVYHAGLTLWAYGMLPIVTITEVFPPLAGNPDPNIIVWLDGSDTAQAQRFMEIKAGRPAVRGANDDQRAFLNTPGLVLKAVSEVMRDNAKDCEDPGTALPPITENLIQLMTDLSTTDSFELSIANC